MERDQALADAVAVLLEQTAAIPTALAALTTQVDTQTDLLQGQRQQLAAQVALLQALRDNARRSDLIQGRLHQLVQAQIAAQTEMILAASTHVSAEMQELLAVVRELRDEARVAKAPITITASASAGTVQQGTANVTGVAIRELRGGDVRISGERVAVTQYPPAGATRPSGVGAGHGAAGRAAARHDPRCGAAPVRLADAAHPQPAVLLGSGYSRPT